MVGTVLNHNHKLLIYMSSLSIKKWLFWMTAFIKPIRSNLKAFRKLWWAGKKSTLQKSNFGFGHVNMLKMKILTFCTYFLNFISSH